MLLILGHPPAADAIVIAVVLSMNAVIDFVQERKAERSVRGLMHVVAPHARVIRGGRGWDVQSCHLVPGDLVLPARRRGLVMGGSSRHPGTSVRGMVTPIMIKNGRRIDQPRGSSGISELVGLSARSPRRP